MGKSCNYCSEQATRQVVGVGVFLCDELNCWTRFMEEYSVGVDDEVGK